MSNIVEKAIEQINQEKSREVQEQEAKELFWRQVKAVQKATGVSEKKAISAVNQQIEHQAEIAEAIPGLIVILIFLAVLVIGSIFKLDNGTQLQNSITKILRD